MANSPNHLAHALAAHAQGWAAFPLRPRSKIPNDREHTFKQATHDRAQIEAWWQASPNANIGIATGEVSGIFVLDLDRHGENDGLATLAQLEAKHGPLPRTVTVITGGGGEHRYFRMPEGVDIRNSAGKVGPGIDIRANGGYVVGAGSIHDNGNAYRYAEGLCPDDVEVAEAPEWLIELIPTPERTSMGTAAAVGETIPEGQRNATLASLGGSMRRRGMLESEILAALTAVNEQRCVPPLPAAEVRRIAASLMQYEPAQTASVSFEVGQDGRPELRVSNRQLGEMTGEATAILDAANDPPVLFARGGRLVRIRVDEEGRPSIINVGPSEVRARLVEVCDIIRLNADGDRLNAIPPRELIENVLAQPAWPFPVLDGISQQPFLRPDGTVCMEPGYDAATRTVLIPAAGLIVPDVSETPDGADVAAARVLIDQELLGDFPFEDEASRANAIAVLLTIVCRRAIAGRVPAVVLDKPQPGTGASLLAEVIGIVAAGRTPAMTTAPMREEEWAKTLLAVALQGAELAVFDNVTARVRSASLASALTTGFVTGRILGVSQMAVEPQRALFVITGNNVRLGTDLARRTVWIRLDARQARPWSGREFRHRDLIGWAESHRGELLHALLTIARAWVTAGRPEGDVDLGGFNAWARSIGGMLAVAGVEGFMGNLTGLYDRVDDESPQWEGFLRALLVVTNGSSFRTREVPRLLGSMKGESARDALPDDFDPDERGFGRRLGHALRRISGVRYGEDGIHLEPAGKANVRQWRVVVAHPDRSPESAPTAPVMSRTAGVGSSVPAVPSQPSPNAIAADSDHEKAHKNRENRKNRTLRADRGRGALGPAVEAPPPASTEGGLRGLLDDADAVDDGGH